MSQGETARLHELGVGDGAQASFLTPSVRALIAAATPEARARVVELIKASQGTATYGDTGLDETLQAIRDEMRRFSEAEIVPHAQDWHLKDDYVPLPLIAQMNPDFRQGLAKSAFAINFIRAAPVFTIKPLSLYPTTTMKCPFS
jgi:(2S)-methylsuccinyl-CoA dehydrogenase